MATQNTENKKVRVQLSSNFQVVELYFDSINEINPVDIVKATDLVNQLGKNVINEIKVPNKKETKKETNTVEMISEKQIECLTKFGHMTVEDAKKLTKAEAQQLIKDRMANNKK